MTSLASKQPEKQSHEAYPCVGSQAAPSHFASRTAEKQAAFFLPYLRPNLDLLDCGCGPGSITLGLATVVAPGAVVGIDSDPRQIELAQKYLAGKNVQNLRFETADIYALPFPDGSFDAAFSNAVLMYLPDPLTALHEIYRVLKPGGVVGIRDTDYDGQLIAPPDPLLNRFWQVFYALVQRKGGNPYRGKQQRALLRQAGFVRIQASASYECYGTAEGTRQFARVLSDALREDTYTRQFVEFGLAERPELERMRQAWQTWSENPDAFAAQAYCEVVGWKE